MTSMHQQSTVITIQCYELPLRLGQEDPPGRYFNHNRAVNQAKQMQRKTGHDSRRRLEKTTHRTWDTGDLGEAAVESQSRGTRGRRVQAGGTQSGRSLQEDPVTE